MTMMDKERKNSLSGEVSRLTLSSEGAVNDVVIAQCRVLYDYDGQGEEELTIRESK